MMIAFSDANGIVPVDCLEKGKTLIGKPTYLSNSARKFIKNYL
jgi:hypothetical protein